MEHNSTLLFNCKATVKNSPLNVNYIQVEPEMLGLREGIKMRAITFFTYFIF